jgi:hypothetical protein
MEQLVEKLLLLLLLLTMAFPEEDTELTFSKLNTKCSELGQEFMENMDR